MNDADGLDVSLVELAPDGLLDEKAAFWQDAIVFVLAGEIELECSSGERHRFDCGDILSLARLPLRSVRNSGSEPTTVLAVRRRAAIREISG